MKKNEYQRIALDKGEISVYDFGTAKLHAYKTNDFLSDEVFVIEKDGSAIIIEQPCFFDNISELTKYIATLEVKVVGKLLAYHMAGGTFLPNTPVYATKNADEYGHTGGGKALIDKFTGAFGALFDASISSVTNTVQPGDIDMNGISVTITETAEAFNIELSELGVVYTHMLGHDCHSIVAGASHADAIIAEMESYIESGFDLILNSHYTPEDLKDAETKIGYLKKLKGLAAGCDSAAAFKTAMQNAFPDYAGENYLDMTADFFFPTK